MNIFLYLMLGTFLVSCSTVSENPNKNDERIFNNVIGEWAFTYGPETCRDYVNIGFRKTGKFTKTSESCNFVDDGFGIYHHGWYIADGFICFVFSKEHLKHAKSFGFAKDHCDWEVIEFSKNELVVHEHDWYSEDDTAEILIFKRQ